MNNLAPEIVYLIFHLLDGKDLRNLRPINRRLGNCASELSLKHLEIPSSHTLHKFSPAFTESRHRKFVRTVSIVCSEKFDDNDADRSLSEALSQLPSLESFEFQTTCSQGPPDSLWLAFKLLLNVSAGRPLFTESASTVRGLVSVIQSIGTSWNQDPATLGRLTGLHLRMSEEVYLPDDSGVVLALQSNLNTALRAMKSLEVLSLDFGWPDDNRLDAASLKGLAWQNLRELSLYGICLTQYNIVDCLSDTITKLHIRSVTNLPGWTDEEAQKTAAHLRACLEQVPNLEDLSLSSTFLCWLGKDFPPDVYWPKLQRLALGQLALSEALLVRLIGKHVKTLRYLHLERPTLYQGRWDLVIQSLPSLRLRDVEVTEHVEEAETNSHWEMDEEEALQAHRELRRSIQESWLSHKKFPKASRVYEQGMYIAIDHMW